jgi:hypothetical protein
VVSTRIPLANCSSPKTKRLSQIYAASKSKYRNFLELCNPLLENPREFGNGIYSGSPDVSFAIPAFHVSAFGGQGDKRYPTALDHSLANERKIDVCIYASAFPSQDQYTK